MWHLYTAILQCSVSTQRYDSVAYLHIDTTVYCLYTEILQCGISDSQSEGQTPSGGLFTLVLCEFGGSLHRDTTVWCLHTDTTAWCLHTEILQCGVSDPQREGQTPSGKRGLELECERRDGVGHSSHCCALTIRIH